MDHLNSLTERIIGAAMAVNRALGPGLLESVRQRCLVLELRACGVEVQEQVAVGVGYRGVTVADALRLDLLVNGVVIVGVKAVESVLPVHEAPLLTDLKLSGKRLGLLLNFNVPLLKDGIRRRVL